MPWTEMKLRGAKVLARVDESGAPKVEGGRVEIRYKPADGRAYRATARNLTPIDGARLLPDAHCGPADPVAVKAKAGSKKKSGRKSTMGSKASAPKAHEEGAVIVYADGACSGNPGPAGLGVVILDGDEKRELSEYLGRGTNNIAELTGILRAAEALRDHAAPIRIYTDSQYSIGVLTKGWKAKKNPELIAAVKDALAQLDDVKLYYVPGHAGHDLNEHADQLAREAVETRGTRGWTTL